MRIAIIGAGLIGRAWAIVFARAGCDAALYDPDAAARDQAPALIERNLRDLQAAGLIEAAPPVLARISVEASMAAALEGAAHVQENGPEQVEAKQRIFAEIDAAAGPEATIASSSSAIPASAFTEGLPGRARCLIAHPVNPPYLVPLVELCPAPWTDPAAVTRVRELMQQVGQVPVVMSREIGGFLLNRLQGALLNEAFRLVEDGYASAEDLDKTIVHGLAMRWSFIGPFETIDLNAPGGLADYARRYAPMYEQMARETTARPWRADTIAQLQAEQRAKVPMAQHGERQAWRDRRLMALLRHRRADREDWTGDPPFVASQQ